MRKLSATNATNALLVMSLGKSALLFNLSER